MSLRFKPRHTLLPAWDFLGLDEGSSLAQGLVALVDFNLGKQDWARPGATFGAASGVKGSRAGFGADMVAGSTAIVRSTGVSIAASGDYTFVAQVAGIGWAGTNPGCWRTANDFNIFNSTTGRPWIRIGGFDDLKPVSGWQETAGSDVTFAFRARSAKDLAYASNGRMRHTATTTRNVSAASLTDFGYQNATSESATGRWTFIAWWNRGLTDEEMESVTSDPRQILREPEVPTFFTAAAGGFKAAWASRRGGVIGVGRGF